jgi:pre-mRNA-splicing factor ATP-dependent RNA helicase DHX16
MATNADLIKQFKNYELVSMESDEERPQDGSKKRKDSKKRDPSKKSKYRERKADRFSDEEEAVIISKRKKIKDIHEDVMLDEAEVQRIKDIEERDDFVSRLIDRDEKRTKKYEGHIGLDAKQMQELATKGSLGNGDKSSDISKLREISRQHYLEKREDKELKLLEISMKDEHELFEGERLTKEEQRRLKLNQRILSMATDKQRFTYKDNGYHIPDGYEDDEGRIDKKKRESVLTKRYQEEEVTRTEQEVWEEAQMKLSLSKPQHAHKKSAKDEEYKFIFEDQVDFVSSEILRNALQQEEQGSRPSKQLETAPDVAEVAKSRSKELSPHENILLGRHKLPVYAYREEFLAAVRDNKVLVVVGETGSGRQSNAYITIYA